MQILTSRNCENCKELTCKYQENLEIVLKHKKPYSKGSKAMGVPHGMHQNSEGSEANLEQLITSTVEEPQVINKVV